MSGRIITWIQDRGVLERTGDKYALLYVIVRSVSTGRILLDPEVGSQNATLVAVLVVL